MIDHWSPLSQPIFKPFELHESKERFLPKPPNNERITLTQRFQARIELGASRIFATSMCRCSQFCATYGIEADAENRGL
jgi:hypothetical protein